MTDPRLRPYAVTGGRVRAESDLPLEAPITRGPDRAAGTAAMPEHLDIWRRCATPQTVVDLSAALHAPVGVVRVLVLDLADAGAVVVHHGGAGAIPPHRNLSLLQEALHGIADL